MCIRQTTSASKLSHFMIPDGIVKRWAYDHCFNSVIVKVTMAWLDLTKKLPAKNSTQFECKKTNFRVVFAERFRATIPCLVTNDIPIPSMAVRVSASLSASLCQRNYGTRDSPMLSIIGFSECLDLHYALQFDQTFSWDDGRETSFAIPAEGGSQFRTKFMYALSLIQRQVSGKVLSLPTGWETFWTQWNGVAIKSETRNVISSRIWRIG